MNRKIILAFAWTSLPFLSLNAQTYQLDNGWEFQRLDKVQKQAAIKNQGSEWSSQFNIQHVKAENLLLAVHPDTLAREMKQLAKGEWEQVSLPRRTDSRRRNLCHLSGSFPQTGCCKYPDSGGQRFCFR